MDSELAKKYLTLLRGRGVSCETGVRIGEIVQTKAGLRVIYQKKSKERTADADLILMATGRRPFMDGLGIEDAGIRTENGAIAVDRFLKTSAEGGVRNRRCDRRPDVGSCGFISRRDCRGKYCGTRPIAGR